MRTALICLLLIISTPGVKAQQNLSGSARTSTYTYVYRIDPKEARLLFIKGMKSFNQAAFTHTLVDSFLVNDPKPILPPANYLLISSWENELMVEQYEPLKINCKLIGNNYDLQLFVTGPDGQPVKNAQVKVGKKQVPFDAALDVYRLSKFRKQGIVEVDLDGTLYFFTLSDSRHRPKLFPLKRIFHKVKYSQRRWQPRPDYFDGYTAYEHRFSGFMVFSKPMYKAGDTVKLKAWVMPQKGKPVNRPLILRLTGEYFSVDTIIATIQPYRPGGYEYSFVLNDSLNLDLDEEYLLTLEEESSRKYDLDEYDGDLEEDEYALKREVLIRNKFWHEEYELKSVSYKARTDKKLHNTNDPVSLYFKATDENEMAVMDGRVSVLIRPEDYTVVYKDSILFLKDTLWLWEQPMDAVGETKIVIPDSVFPAASFSYRIYCTFLNSNNERHDTLLTQQYRHQQTMAKLEQRRDSLYVQLTANGKDAKEEVIIIAMNARRDTIRKETIKAPVAIKIHPFAAEYIVIAGDTLHHRPETHSLLHCSTDRTADSVFIRIDNPAALPCWYTVFNGKKKIQQGRGNALDFSSPADKGSVWFVSIQYIYQDAVQRLEYSIPFDKKELNVQLKQPEFIYPGQQTPVEVVVTDGNGHPVADADITLYGFTAKFPNVRAPALPFMEEASDERKARNYFAIRYTGTDQQPVKLDWEIWSRRMMLDSIEYYKFLYPDSVYVNYEPAKDSITQIAPFVVSGGSPEAIHMLYIDDQPYFFRGAQQWHQYSFPVDSGWHTLKMRIHNKEVYAKKVFAAKGVKTIVSVNADSVSSISGWKKMPDSLTTREKLYWDQYLILVDNNFNSKFAWVKQDEKLLVLRHDKNVYHTSANNTFLVGPLRGFNASFNVKDKYTRQFDMEAGYHYTFASDLVKMRQLSNRYKPYGTWLSKEKQIVSLFDQAITMKTIDSLWTDLLDYRMANVDLFHYSGLYSDDLGRLKIGVTGMKELQPDFVKSVLLFRKGDPDFLRVYKGVTRDLGRLREGQYRLLLLLKNNQYLLKEDLVIHRNGTNYYSVDLANSKPADNTSKELYDMISRRDYRWRDEQASRYSADSIRTAFNNTYLQLDSSARTVTGVVTENGQPLGGVQVMLKNTRYGTVTAPNGFFSIKAPERGTLAFSSVGYQSVEKSLDQRQFYEVTMTVITQALSEVIVVGYGAQERKMSMTGSVMSITSRELQGRVSGVSAVRIRGNSSVGGSTKPLILRDRLPVDLDLKDIDESEIGDIQVLPADKAIALWGARGAAGVIVITTKKKLQENKGFDTPTDETLPGNTLRINFRDEAYWFPSLRTGADGKASVKVQFPDDITNWKTFAIAMTDNRRAGLAVAHVKSFKAISGTLYLPSFAVAGDELNVLGKAMNYTTDSIDLKRTFSENGKLVRQEITGVKNNLVDTFAVVASGDSLKLSYTIQRSDGYFDGEERKIKVFPQGVMEPNGVFAAMDHDTVINWKPEPGSEVTIHAEASALPVLMDEVEYVHRYEYLCNEQLASKLKALLLKRKVYKLQQKKFENDKDIGEIISKLNKSKAEDNLWGWWKDGQSTPWITLHVVEALLAAEQQKFTITMSREMIGAYLVHSLDRTPRLVGAMVPKLRVLKQMGSNILFKPWLDTLAKYDKGLNVYEQLSLLAFKQELETTPVPDSLLLKRRQTAFGNIYWGEEGYHFFDNSIQNTLLMYRILKADGRYNDLLKRIRRYFMEKRSDGHWRNTYESVLILETILPDLMEEPAFNQPSSLVIRQGTVSHTVTSFPFHLKGNNKEEISVEKKGQRPVYFTASQQKWNPAPEKVDSTFSVKSFFRQGRDTVARLKAGVPVILEVEVKVNADASYVMLEIPIPAGCSYNSKTASRYNNEVNREHFINKTSIFCSELKKGTYKFTVSLLPRYTGTYHLNPANACMMYFPVFFGREGMKKVNIR